MRTKPKWSERLADVSAALMAAETAYENEIDTMMANCDHPEVYRCEYATTNESDPWEGRVCGECGAYELIFAEERPFTTFTTLPKENVTRLQFYALSLRSIDGMDQEEP